MNVLENKFKKFQSSGDDQQRIIRDLVAEIAIVLNDKANLEKANASLKLECLEVKHKFNDLERERNEEKTRLLEMVKKTEELVQEKEIFLVKKDVQNLEEQRKYIMEVNDLKSKIANEKNLFEKTKRGFENEMSIMKNRVFETLNDCGKHKINYQNKTKNYKIKVQYALQVINALSIELKKRQLGRKKPNTLDKECQTKSNER